MRSPLVLLGMLLFWACAPPAGKKPEPEQSVTVQVENRNWSDVVVYAVGGGVRMRLGMVSATGTATFTLPRLATSSGHVRLLADPIGSRETFLSEPVAVRPGSRLVLELGPDLQVSFLSPL